MTQQPQDSKPVKALSVHFQRTLPYPPGQQPSDFRVQIEVDADTVTLTEYHGSGEDGYSGQIAITREAWSMVVEMVNRMGRGQ